MLEEKDASLAQVARTAPPPPTEASKERRESAASKKRRSSLDDGPDSKRRSSSSSAKKRGSSVDDSNKANDPSLVEREVRAMDNLAEFVSKNGGDEALVQDYRSRVTKKASDGRYDINFYNEQGRRFRSMLDVGRFLGLVDASHRSSAVTSGKLKKRKRDSTTTPKAVEMEKKKLRKELDRLRKQFGRASKSLDDFMGDGGGKDSTFPIEDSLLEDSDRGNDNGQTKILPTNCSGARIPDVGSFRGLPSHCMPDVLQAWDFLCTFSRSISVTPIPLDDFIQCLTYKPPQKLAEGDILKNPPIYLGEAHLGLLKLILADASSDEWWWSILETEHTENAVIADRAVDDDAVKEEESDLPLIRVDFAALLAFEEDPSLTNSWLLALESVGKIRVDDKTGLKQALSTAMGLMANKWALAYVRKAVKLGKTSGPAFMKRAVAWLHDKVVEAKPELTQQRASSRASSEAQKKRAQMIEEVNQQMDKLSSAALTVTDDDLASDIEDEDEDDESDDELDDKQEEQVKAAEATKHANSSDEDRIASYIPQKPPPSLVDFLLPPGKPIPPSELISPTSWPELAGAAGCRIIHRYKRLRNEVDDGLRRSRELPMLTVRERRAREDISTGRVLTEFVTMDGKDGPTERACAILCAGGDYLELSPLERLALLRVLIEAAYDTFMVYGIVDSNHKQRTNAAKALTAEQRRASKEAKEKAVADEKAARDDLANELKTIFLEEKREEIRKFNEKNPAFDVSQEEIDMMTEEDILEFDDNFKADFEALPTPESFKKAEVVERIARNQEAAAFETELLIVVSMEEILEREKKTIEGMQHYLEELGGEEALMNPEIERSLVRKIEKLRRDIQKAQDATEFLPAMREEAIEALKDAIADGTIKSLRASLRTAKTAKLYGPDEETNGVFSLDVVRDAHMELEKAKQKKRVTDAQKDLVSKLKKCFIRTKPIGSDRYRNRFWRFENSDQSHIWVEVNPVLNDSHRQLKNEAGFLEVAHDSISEIATGPPDIEDDFPPTDASESKNYFEAFGRREYHASGATASLVKRSWGCHVNESSVRALMKGLDSRGLREDTLKKNLKEALEEKTARAEAAVAAASEKPIEPVKDGEEKTTEEEDDVEEGSQDLFDTSGDEGFFEQAKKDPSTAESDLIENVKVGSLGTSAIGQKVRVRVVVEATKDGDIARYQIGSVTGWKKYRENVAIQTGETEFEPQMREVTLASWRALTESGEEVWLSGAEVLESIFRYGKWETNDPEYYEYDSTFLCYRNHLGKHFGKAADAPQAMLPIRFGQHMVRREAELYQRLKTFAVENEWGGKSGARNAWITSMRDFAFEFQTVKEGLLALENAFFELIGGTFKEEQSGESERTALELLSDPVAREDIELEAIDSSVSGLWTSKASRSVFLQIVS
ncbi:MAG: hypothetical protein SGILL_004917, partial [Bacillariaceae sp.]